MKLSKTYEEFVNRGAELFIEEPHLRVGQAYFIALNEIYPSLADEITATTLDPFYCSERLVDFLEYVQTRWI